VGSIVNIKNRKFGKLLALEKVGSSNTHSIWRTICECGRRYDVPYSNLISGNTTRCKQCFADSMKKISDETVRKMIALRGEGKSYASIARQFGYNYNTTYNAIMRMIKKSSSTSLKK